MPQVKLNHTCNREGMQGYSGDVIDVTDEQAEYLFERKGATPWPPPPVDPHAQDDHDDDDDVIEYDEETDEPAEVLLDDILNKKDGRDNLADAGYTTLEELETFMNDEEKKLTELPGITKGKAAKIEQKIAAFKQQRTENATKGPAENAATR